MALHTASRRPSTAGILLLLLAGACALDCDTEMSTGLPGLDGLAHFAKHRCPSKCQYATRKEGDICSLQCVSTCGVKDKARAYTDEGEMTCDKCVAGCKNCKTKTECHEDGCHEGFKFDKGICKLPMEGLVSSIVFYTAVSLGVILGLLLICFGGIRRFLERTLNKATDDLKEKLLNQESNADVRPDIEHTVAETNWDIMWHAIKQTRQSSIRCTRARKTTRREAVNSPDEFVEDNVDEGYQEAISTTGLNYLALETKSYSGIGMLLFRNTQKFYLFNMLALAASVIVFMFQIGDMAEHVNKCVDSPELYTNDIKWGDNSSIEAAKKHFRDDCCGPNLPEAVTYAEALFWWGGTMWVIAAIAAIIFAKFQMWAVMQDEYFQQGFGIDEQDYTLLLQNLPKNITSEERLKHEIETRLNLHGKIYGVSIVYDVKEPEWEKRINEMLENLVRYDLATCEYYSQEVKGYYTKVTPLEELKAKVKQDEKDFVDWLSGTGKMGELRRSKDRDDGSITSGEAYVVFKRKVDLKMFLPCVRAIQWPVEDDELHKIKADPYHLVQVNEVQWEPSDVMWMDCVPTRAGMRCQIITSSITMFAMLLVMFALTGAVFYSSILPYREVGASAESSSNLTYTNMLLSLVCMLIPGMPAGLAQGIGYTRMNQMEGFIFFFIFCVFGVWNLTTIVVQWGIAGLFEGIEDLSLPNIAILVQDMGPSKMKEEMKWSFVVPSVMFPGQLIQGYIINELLTALLPLIIPTAVSLCVYYFHVFPQCVRQKVAQLMLQADNEKVIDAYTYEKQIALQPYRLSMEYAFMMWVPMLSLLVLFFFAERSTLMFIFGGLVIYALLMMIFVHVCIHVMRDTSFDSVSGFVAFIQAWGDALAFLPCISVWWAMRLDWISPKVGIIMAIIVWCAFRLFYLQLLRIIGFGEVMKQKMMTEAFSLQKHNWEQMESQDKGFGKVLDTAGYSWWNMNPVYVLKHRYCPNLEGHQIHSDTDCPVWPAGYVLKSLVQLGKDWRFKSGEDPNLTFGDQKVSSNQQRSHAITLKRIERALRKL